jgi:hypothetical protein
MRTRLRPVDLLPFAPCLVGLALSAWRFRLRDPFSGLLWGELGMLLMVAVAMRMRER